MDYINQVGAVAEAEGHHPDLHLYGYNNVCVSLSTHSLGGVTVNDIVLAVKIDAVPVKLSRRPPEPRADVQDV
jgi:4a-hydroxytetrahydrobiopterin dehydratase